jgi:hypothetical protein
MDLGNFVFLYVLSSLVPLVVLARSGLDKNFCDRRVDFESGVLASQGQILYRGFFFPVPAADLLFSIYIFYWLMTKEARSYFTFKARTN